MKINPQIVTILQEFNIPVADGVSYFLSVFFDCRPSYTPSILIQRLMITNVLCISDQREIMWNIPLFESESQDKCQWVLECNAEFKRINKLRKGPDKDVITRMKAFFADNPDVRKEEVIEATSLYFKSLSHSDYLISSHYFISKGVGRDRTSALLGWIEKYREAISDTSANNVDDITTRMQ
jgi:hypothetical protein